MVRSIIDVVHVGSASRDIALDDPRGWRLGGGVTYSALTTARLGLRTAAIIGVDAEAARASELDLLRDAGVQIRLVELASGPIFDNVETPTGRVQTCIEPGVALPIPTFPQGWLAAPGWSVVPVAGEIRETWAAVVPRHAHVAVAWQGLLRALRAGERVRRVPPRPSPILIRADVIGVSRHDVAADVPLRSLWSLLSPGADLLITEGADGGLLVRLGADGPVELLRYRAPASTREIDPTGAGDTFLAALHASGLRAAVEAGLDRGQPRAVIRGALDLQFAAAAGSLVVEHRGPSGVPTTAAVSARLTRDAGLDAVAPISPEDARHYWPEEPAPA